MKKMEKRMLHFFSSARERQIESAKKLWNTETYKYDEKKEVTFRRVLAIANEIKKTKLGNKVLDIGCGLAILQRILGEEYQYYGCDISHEIVQKHNSPHIVECDLDHDPLPFKGIRFNYVVCSGIAEYLSDVRRFLRDTSQQYGHENCLFLITVSNSTHLWNRIRMLEGHFPIDVDRSTVDRSLLINFFSPKDFLKLLLECQFKVLKYYPTHLRSRLGRAFPSLYGDQFLYLCAAF